MTQHTPTPWIVKKVRTQVGYCFNVGPQHIVDDTHGGACLYDDSTSFNPHAEGEQEANAAFIVTACNCHDELVAALRDAHDLLGQYKGHARYKRSREYCTTMTAIESILAKAEGR